MRVKIMVAMALLAGVGASCVPDPVPGPDPVLPPATVVAAPFACAPLTGDNASSLGDSAATQGLLSTLTPGGGGGSLVNFPDATIAAAVPSSIAAGAPTTAVGFKLQLGGIPNDDAFLKPARELLKLATIDTSVQRLSVAASGATTATWTTSAPPTPVSTLGPLVFPTTQLFGSVSASSPGAIAYQVRPVRVSLRFEAEVAGVVIHALTYDCTTTAVLPGTTVTG